jgi:hypothetical protein
MNNSYKGLIGGSLLLLGLHPAERSDLRLTSCDIGDYEKQNWVYYWLLTE